MTDRSARQPLELPTPPWPEAATLYGEYRRTLDAWRKTARERAAHQHEPARGEAIRRDREAAVEAALAGRELPKPDVHQTQRLERLRRAQQAEGALATIRNAAEDRFVEHIVEHRDRYLDELDELIRQANEEAAVTITEDSLTDLTRLLQWRAWLERFPHKRHGLLPRSVLIPIGGERYTAAEVFGGLRAAIAESVAVVAQRTAEEVGA